MNQQSLVQSAILANVNQCTRITNNETTMTRESADPKRKSAGGRGESILLTDKELQPLDTVLRFEPSEPLEPTVLEQKVDPFHAFRLLLTLRPLAPGRLESASVRARNVRLLRPGQAAPLPVRDLAVERRVYGVNDVLERQIRQRRPPSTVRRQRSADHLHVDGPLGNDVAHDAHPRHLRVHRRLLEVVRAQRRDIVRARSGALPDHEVELGKVDVQPVRDDLPVDEVVKLRARQRHRRQGPSGGVGVVRRWYCGPSRHGWRCGLEGDVGGIEGMSPDASVARMEQPRLIDWHGRGRGRCDDGKKCR